MKNLNGKSGLKMFNRYLLLVLIFASLAACKAERLEIEIKEKTLQSALSGQEEMVDFEINFEQFGTLDDGQKAQVKALESILENYIDLEDFEVKTTDMGFEIDIEGEFLITTNGSSENAYFLHLSPSEELPGYTLLQLKTGGLFSKMKTEMQAINYMLAPNEYHPTDFKIKADGLEVLAVAAELDGESHLVWSGKVTGRERFSFRDGIYDSIGAGLFFK